jgi:hypothetical protein
VALISRSTHAPEPPNDTQKDDYRAFTDATPRHRQNMFMRQIHTGWRLSFDMYKETHHFASLKQSTVRTR